jgi:guanylate kinase
MKNLFIIDGAAGTGKSDMVRYLKRQHPKKDRVKIVTKYTTREIREEEKNQKEFLDLEFITAEEFDKHKKDPDFCFYIYRDEKYGFYKKKLDSAIREFKNVFVIIRNRVLAEEIIKSYPDICTVLAFIYSDQEKVIERLKKDKYSQEAIEFRLNRVNIAWEDYLKNAPVYKEVIINNSDKKDFQRLIDLLIRKYTRKEPDILEISFREKFSLSRPLIGFKNEMEKRLVEFPYEKNIFLMMKFRETNRLIHKFITKIIKENGFNCVRSDDEYWDITNNLYNPIAALYCCKYGIALFNEPEDGSNFSPNVAYELGVMHNQGKNCLILRHKNLPAMPFDIMKDVHNSYDSDLEVERILSKWIKNLR